MTKRLTRRMHINQYKSVGEGEDVRLVRKHHTAQKPKKLSLSATILWKCVFFIMALFFMAAAYVQHNDPDPYLWMPAYLVPMFINIILIIWLPFDRYETPFSSWNSTSVWKWLRSWKFLNKIIAIHSAYCYTLGIWTLAHFAWRHLTSTHDIREEHDIRLIESWVTEQNMFMEEAKELLGLCLVIAWLSFLQNGTFLRFGKRGIYFGAFLTSLPILAWQLGTGTDANSFVVVPQDEILMNYKQARAQLKPEQKEFLMELLAADDALIESASRGIVDDILQAIAGLGQGQVQVNLLGPGNTPQAQPQPLSPSLVANFQLTSPTPQAQTPAAATSPAPTSSGSSSGQFVLDLAALDLSPQQQATLTAMLEKSLDNITAPAMTPPSHCSSNSNSNYKNVPKYCCYI
ncbi:Transmembrane protein [Orchesella cincta]|uniref:Transmembrane protein n=1 Tax=Orchesella cincta TaxID=48709 RepID=A0A1D2MR57_ORCCI|nr:Transmembrane protein [Orchesella cincta]